MERPVDEFSAPIPPEYAHLREWQRLLEMGVDTQLLAASIRMTVQERLEALAAADAVYHALHGAALRG